MAKRIIAIKSKKSETVYLYEDESYWNKEKDYSTHKRTCIGKLGPDGKPIYNEYTKTRKMIQDLTADAKKPRRSIPLLLPARRSSWTRCPEKQVSLAF